jgi:hypothetical protein
MPTKTRGSETLKLSTTIRCHKPRWDDGWWTLCSATDFGDIQRKSIRASITVIVVNLAAISTSFLSYDIWQWSWTVWRMVASAHSSRQKLERHYWQLLSWEQCILEILPPISSNGNLPKLRNYSEMRDYERLPSGVMTRWKSCPVYYSYTPHCCCWKLENGPQILTAIQESWLRMIFDVLPSTSSIKECKNENGEIMRSEICIPSSSSRMNHWVDLELKLTVSCAPS